MRVYILLGLFSLLSACTPEQTKIDQSQVCMYQNDEQAKACPAGKLSYFQPSTWGNEQLVLNAAVVYCDFNYQVMHTNAGVICTHTHERLHLLSQDVEQ